MRLWIASFVILMAISIRADEPKNLVNVLVTYRGKPVPHATIQEVRYRTDRNQWEEQPGPKHRCDDLGRLRLVYESNETNRLLAYGPEGRVGQIEILSFSNSQPEQSIELLDCQPFSCQFVDDGGKPIAGAHVQLEFVNPNSPNVANEYLANRYLKFLKSPETNAVSDAEGRFTIPSVPSGCHIGLLFDAGDFGRGRVMRSFEDASAIKLVKAGSVRIVGQKPNQSLVGMNEWDWRINVDSTRLELPSKSPHYSPSVDSWRKVTPNAEGVLRGLPPGDYVLQRLDSKNKSFNLHDDITFSIQSGKTTELIAPVVPLVAVTMKVIDEATSRPVEGCPIRLMELKPEEQRRPFMTGMPSDAQGVVRVPLLPDREYSISCEAYFRIGLRCFVVLDDDGKPGRRTIRVGPTQDDPFIVVVRELRRVSGTVVNANGQLIVPPYELKTYGSFVESSFEKPRYDGTTFYSAPVSDESSLSVRVAQGNAVNIPQLFSTKDASRPLRISISEANAVSISGRVVDQTGRPLPKTKVTIFHLVSFKNQTREMQSQTFLKSEETDAEGAYRFIRLWPEDQYAIVAGEGVLSSLTDKIDRKKLLRGQPGEAIRANDIVVNTSTVELQGRVFNSQRRPVVNAIVLIRQIGSKPITVKTGPDGRWNAQGLKSRPDFVTAIAEGHHPAMAAVTRDTSEVSMTMTPNADPPPQPAAATELRNSRTAILNELREELWQKRSQHNYGPSLFRDSPTAERWLKELTGDEKAKYQPRLIAAQTEEQWQAMIQSEGATALLAKLVESKVTPNRIADLGQKFLSSNPAVALQAMEASVLVARRDLNNPVARAAQLAHSAVLAHRAGNTTAAEKLFAEADQLAKAAPAPMVDAARSTVATQWGKIDWPTAKTILDTVKEPSYRNRAIGHIAAERAAYRPETVKELFPLLLDSDTIRRDEAKARAAIAMVTTDLPQALAIIESIPSLWIRCQAQMMLARALAEHDPKNAHRQIDRCFEWMESQTDEFESWSNYGGVVTIAGIACHTAQIIKHPKLHSLIVRTLNLRSQTLSERDAEIQTVYLALMLGEADPATARHLIESAYPTIDDFQKSPVFFRTVFFAAASAQPKYFKQVIDSKRANPKGLSSSGIIELLNSYGSKKGTIDKLAQWAGVLILQN